MYPAPAGAGDTDSDSETVSQRLGSSRRSSRVFAHTLKLHLGDRSGRQARHKLLLSDSYSWQGNMFSVIKKYIIPGKPINVLSLWQNPNPIWSRFSSCKYPRPCLALHAWPRLVATVHFCLFLAVQLYYSTMGGRRTGSISRRDTRSSSQSSTQQWRSLQRDWQNCSRDLWTSCY